MTIYVLTHDEGVAAVLTGPDGADLAGLQHEWLTTAAIDVTLADLLGTPMFTQWLVDRGEGWAHLPGRALDFASHRIGVRDLDGLDGIQAPWGAPPPPAPCLPWPAVLRLLKHPADQQHVYHAERRASGAKDWQCISCGHVVPVAEAVPV